MASSAASTGLGLLFFLLVGFGAYRLFFGPNPATRNVVYVNQEIGVNGRVTGFNKARGYKIFLNNTTTPYNFDAFASEQYKPDFGLGYYLEQGDSVSKEPNSKQLTLHKNGRTSQWYLVAPQLLH